MGTKAKTRVCAQIDGLRNELFAIRELPDGSLLLVMNLLGPYKPVPGEILHISQHHYSVHNTKKPNNTCITQKIAYCEGGSTSNIAYIHNTDNHLLWLIYARQLGPLPPPRGFTRPKDRIIEIADFKSKYATLFYSVFVTRPWFTLPRSELDCVSIRKLDFRIYNIYVISSFLNLPTPPISNISGLMTSSQINDGVTGPDHKQLYTESIPTDEMHHVHQGQIIKLGLLMAKWFNEEVPEGPNKAWAGRFFSAFTKEPLIK